jgi:hypothetical protein
MKFFFTFLLSAFCFQIYGQNITNVINGQTVTNGTQLSTVPSAGGGGIPSGTVIAHWTADSLNGATGSHTNYWYDTVNGWTACTSRGSYNVLTNSALNGHNTIFFPADGVFYSGQPSPGLAQPYTAFYVARLSVGADVPAVLFGSTNDFGVFDGINAGPVSRFSAGTTIYGGAIGTEWMVYAFVVNGASSSYYTNGVVNVSGNIGANALNGVNLPGNAGYNWTGSLADVYILSGTPSVADWTTWLRSTYGF